jgi:multidrug efflux pump subunit AcrA (membrane-fusion protein)
LLIDLQIPETDINRVAVGQAVTVTVDAVPGKSYPAFVTSVDLSGHKERNEVDFTVTVALTDTDELLKPGMTAVVVITTPAK